MPHRLCPHDAALVGLMTLAAAASSCVHGRDAAPGVGAPEPFALDLSGWRRHVLVDERGLWLAMENEPTGAEAPTTGLGWGRELGSPSVHRQLRAQSERRIEVDLGWSVGVLADHPEGLEQSWELAARPSTPALEVRVPIEGAIHLGSGEDGLVFRTTDREYLLYGHAVWIDADGRRTPVPARFDGEEIALTVGKDVLDRSSYPAVLDPIIGTARSLTPMQLTNASADQENADIAIGATSRLVVWSDNRNPVVPGVFGTFRDQTGTLAERYSFRIGGGRLTGTPLAPSVAYAAGVYLVTWAAYDTVYAVRVAEGGGVLDSTPLSVFEGGDPKGATLTTDGVGFLVAWIDEGTPSGVRARRVATDGSFVGAAFFVREDTADHLGLRVAHDPAGGYWVLFDENSSGDRDLALVRLAADASVRDAAPIRLAPGFADQSSPDIAFSGARSAVVVYEDSSSSAVHGLTVTEDAGGTLSFGTPTRISAGSGERAARVVHAAGNYHVGWISSAPGSLSPQVATIAAPVRADGVTLGMGTSSRIALAVEGTSAVHAVWDTRNADTDAIDVYRRARSGGAWEFETYLVSQAPPGQRAPKIANNSSRSLAVWVERTAGGAQVYGARINALGEFEDVTPFRIGDETIDAVMVGVYSNGTDFLVAWQARDLRSFVGGSLVVWVQTVARVTTAGVASSPIDCGVQARDISPFDIWVDSSVFPTRYVASFVDGDVIYNSPVGTRSCSSRFLYENASVIDSTHLVATPSAVYFVSSDGDLWRVGHTTDPRGGVGAPFGVAASDLATLDVLALTGTSDTIAYSSSPPRFPLEQRVGVVRVGATGAIEWHIPDLADRLPTTANPQITRSDDGTFVVWRRTDNSIVGQRLGELGERIDPAPVSIDAEPQSRFLGDIVTDFLDRSMLVYSAVLPEQGWATRIRARSIDFRFDAGGAIGAACVSGFDCASGICADGVCCSTACGYSSPNDCQACSVAAGAAVDGTCSTLPSSTECRASAGECDVAEVCDGVSTACPADALAPADSACGSSAEGPCDLADRCNGASASCEPGGLVSAGTPCSPSRGGCDAEDRCDGAQAACPDGFLAPGSVCRAAGGACDVPETCDGATDVCPSDVLEMAGVVCRPMIGGCDVAERCDGFSPACPADVVLDATRVCRAAAGPCDREESCDGALGVCPRDAFLGASAECRPAAGECDEPELCDGASAACGDDASAANGSACGDDALVCESASCLDGVCVSTPVVCAGGAVCSEAIGGCPTPRLDGGSDPDPSPGSGCGCHAIGAGGSTLPAAIVVLIGLARLRRRRARAALGLVGEPRGRDVDERARWERA